MSYKTFELNTFNDPFVIMYRKFRRGFHATTPDDINEHLGIYDAVYFDYSGGKMHSNGYSYSAVRPKVVFQSENGYVRFMLEWSGKGNDDE